MCIAVNLQKSDKKQSLGGLPVRPSEQISPKEQQPDGLAIPKGITLSKRDGCNMNYCTLSAATYLVGA